MKRVLVLVKWQDTFADVGWGTEELSPVKVNSVGWLIHKDKNKIVISSMVGTAGLEDYNCRQAIPRGCITSITNLERGID